MEVHSHTHTPRKKWTHYFWEFFMLFLAVTLGFLVENLREHYVEHQREKRYAQLLFEDLKKDTSFLNTIIGVKEWRSKKIDSLFYYLDQADLQKNSNSIYYYSVCMSLNIPYKPSDATFQQLQSSGSLRYFSNPQLYNSISAYYSICSFYLEREKEGLTEVPPALISKIFNNKDLFSLISVTPNITDAAHYPNEQFELRTTDHEIFNEFLFYAKTMNTGNNVARMLLSQVVRPQLSSLIASLKKEYHLK